MKKYVLPVLFILCLSVSAGSQDFATPEPKKTPAPFWSWDRIYFGGGFGMGFTQYETLIDLSPLVGYKITDRFSVGVGAVYNYYQNRYYTPTLTWNIYGGTVFSRFLITDFLFAHAEYQPLNGPWKFPGKTRFFIHNVWVGGGLRQMVGNNASFNLSVLWNINENAYSYPLSPQIRVGINVGM